PGDRNLHGRLPVRMCMTGLTQPQRVSHSYHARQDSLNRSVSRIPIMLNNYSANELSEQTLTSKSSFMEISYFFVPDNVTTNPSGLPLSAKRPVVKKILEAMAAGIDVSSLFGNVVKAIKKGSFHKRSSSKKTGLYIISTQAEQNADLVILAINTFQKDLHDENLFVRGLSEYVPYMLESLNSALKDSSAYVRKTALISCIKVFHLSPKHVLDTTLIDQLYKTLGDRDSEVVANCVVALNEILHSQGGMTVNKNIAMYLLQRIRDFNEWHQCLILNTLVKYQPNEDDEIYDIMTLKKLELLQDVATDINAKEIVDEISDNGAIANKSIQTISNIAIRIGDLLNESPDKFDGLLSVLPSIWASVDLTSSAGPAFLNLLMTVGNTLPETPYILESLIEDIENYPDALFRLQLLNSSVALLLLRPAECKDMLAKLAKKIFEFRHETTKISNNNSWNTTKGREDEFNTLSIIYGKPSEQFIVDTGPTFYWQNKQEIDSQLSPTLEFDTASEHNRDTFTLSSVNPIDADANVFKSCWSKFIKSDQLEISLPETSMLVKSLTLDDIEYVFKESNIFTIASGNTGDVLKFFLYAKEENSHVLILCELKINIHLASANINIKTG
ncbi:1351_t:CDS:10, partial [Gigaspora rosea]